MDVGNVGDHASEFVRNCKTIVKFLFKKWERKVPPA